MSVNHGLAAIRNSDPCTFISVDGDRSVVSYDQVDFFSPLIQGPICQAIAYGIQAPAPPFPLFVLAPILNGFGMAIQVRILWRELHSTTSHNLLQDAQANGYVASLDNHKEVRMGILHAIYGQGEDLWPTWYSANPQKVLERSPRRWSRHSSPQ